MEGFWGQYTQLCSSTPMAQIERDFGDMVEYTVP